MVFRSIVILLIYLLAATELFHAAPKRAVSHLGVLGFTLGKSTLADVRAKLGRAAVRKCSNEEEASSEICYTSSASDGTTIVFESGASGGWESLDGYRIISGGLHRPCYRGCSPTRFVNEALETSGGLRLGLGRGAVLGSLGQPIRATKTRLTFQWQAKRRLTAKEIAKMTEVFKSPVSDPYCDVLDTIYVTFVNGRVAELHVLHSETY